MATTIAEQIAVKVRQRLATIAATAGFEYSTPGVIRPARLATHRPEDFQITVEQGDQEPNDELSCPGNPPAQAYNLPFMIHGELRQSDVDSTAVDTYRNQFHGDIIRALGDSNSSTWQNWDGLALNTRLGPVTKIISETILTGFTMQIIVIFRTVETDPFTVR